MLNNGVFATKKLIPRGKIIFDEFLRTEILELVQTIHNSANWVLIVILLYEITVKISINKTSKEMVHLIVIIGRHPALK